MRRALAALALTATAVGACASTAGAYVVPRSAGTITPLSITRPLATLPHPYLPATTSPTIATIRYDVAQADANERPGHYQRASHWLIAASRAGSYFDPASMCGMAMLYLWYAGTWITIPMMQGPALRNEGYARHYCPAI